MTYNEEPVNKGHLDEDIESGKSRGVKGTPTFLSMGTAMLENGIWTAFCPHLTKRVYLPGNLKSDN